MLAYILGTSSQFMDPENGDAYLGVALSIPANFPYNSSEILPEKLIVLGTGMGQNVDKD